MVYLSTSLITTSAQPELYNAVEVSRQGQRALSGAIRATTLLLCFDDFSKFGVLSSQFLKFSKAQKGT